MGTPESDGEFPTQAPIDRQGVRLVEAALETHSNRSHSWLGNLLLLGCVIANPNPIVALEATRVLVAVYDGQDKDVEDHRPGNSKRVLGVVFLLENGHGH
jgi:hypothetical protein